jgi:hypothetical protein
LRTAAITMIETSDRIWHRTLTGFFRESDAVLLNAPPFGQGSRLADHRRIDLSGLAGPLAGIQQKR